MTTFTTDAPFPPKGTQIKNGAGTLVSAVVPQPLGAARGSTPIDCVFYDVASGGTPGAPLASIRSAQGYDPTALNLSFTHGLYLVQNSPSAIEVTFS